MLYDTKNAAYTLTLMIPANMLNALLIHSSKQVSNNPENASLMKVLMSNKISVRLGIVKTKSLSKFIRMKIITKHITHVKFVAYPTPMNPKPNLYMKM